MAGVREPVDFRLLGTFRNKMSELGMESLSLHALERLGEPDLEISLYVWTTSLGADLALSSDERDVLVLFQNLDEVGRSLDTPDGQVPANGYDVASRPGPKLRKFWVTHISVFPVG